MRNFWIILTVILLASGNLNAQVEPEAGNWKTWFIGSGKEHRLSPPANYKSEISQVIKAQQNLDSASLQQIFYWNAGAPGYRWQSFLDKLWMNDTSNNGILSNMLLSVSIYDATIVAWDTKYAYNIQRPFVTDKRVISIIQKPDSPTYPCEHSVAAGAAVAIISKFYPAMADSVNKMAQKMMASRIAAGVAFPSDTKAGFELGKSIAEKEIEHTKDFIPKQGWDGKSPEGAGLWKGKPMYAMAGYAKTVVLKSGDQFRPGPPPDFAKDMEEIKTFKPTFRSTANAFHFASQNEDVLGRKIFENNIHLNPPRAARLYALTAVASYDAFIACWDAKYAYWGIRPDQYDTTFKPVLFFTPPFPGYPSGHAMIGAVHAELFSYFFPADKAYFMKRAKDGAESRFQGGIHFRSDNEVGLELGKRVGLEIIKIARADGADAFTPLRRKAM